MHISLFGRGCFFDGSEIIGAGVGSMEGAVSLKIVGSCGSKKSSSSSASSSIPNCSEMVSKNSSSVVRFLGAGVTLRGAGRGAGLAPLRSMAVLIRLIKATATKIRNGIRSSIELTFLVARHLRLRVIRAWRCLP